MHRIIHAAILAVGLLVQQAVTPAANAADETQSTDTSKTPDCVYVGTPYDVIDAMLDKGAIKRSDLVYDLGCGDGRIVVAAARRFGCHGVGYDVDPQRIRECHENVRKEGVGELVQIKQEDIFTLDLSAANVILLYLLPEMNAKLIPQLEMLQPGSRIVTHNYTIEGIAHKESVTFKSLEDGVKHYLYVYEAPLQPEENK